MPYRILFICLLFMLTTGIAAQTHPAPSGWMIALEIAANTPTGLEEASANTPEYGYQVSFGAERQVGLGRRLAFAAGAAFSVDMVGQRYSGLSFGCDLPVSLGGQGQQTYVMSNVVVGEALLPVSLIYYPFGDEDVFYLRPSFTSALTLFNSSSAELHECGSDTGLPFEAQGAEVVGIMVYPGLHLGVRLDKMASATFFEIGARISTGEVLRDVPANPVFDTLSGAGNLIFGFRFGRQFGG